jgi:hypothetical protein
VQEFLPGYGDLCFTLAHKLPNDEYTTIVDKLLEENGKEQSKWELTLQTYKQEPLTAMQLMYNSPDVPLTSKHLTADQYQLLCTNLDSILYDNRTFKGHIDEIIQKVRVEVSAPQYKCDDTVYLNISSEKDFPADTIGTLIKRHTKYSGMWKVIFAATDQHPEAPNHTYWTQEGQIRHTSVDTLYSMQWLKILEISKLTMSLKSLKPPKFDPYPLSVEWCKKFFFECVEELSGTSYVPVIEKLKKVCRKNTIMWQRVDRRTLSALVEGRTPPFCGALWEA